MSTTADLLVELGTEELPPTALLSLSNAFTQGVVDGIKEARLSFDEKSVDSFATPRRLAVKISGLQVQQQDQAIEKLGPAVAAAKDKEGKPSKAALGFAKGAGVSFEDLQEIDTDKGPRLGVKLVEKGAATKDLLEGIVSQSLDKLPIPKRMRWGASRAEFVRPVHWLVLMLDKEVVPANILGLSSGNETFGHRFHAPAAIQLPGASEYEASLAKIEVVASFTKRRDAIVEQVNKVAATLNGKAVLEEGLLDEVTALVEKPVAIAGGFDQEFLSVPHEALIYSMSEHQKYFHVVDDNGQLLPHFITVSNIESKDAQQVAAGNERVIRPRLADAAFFFETDKKVSLEKLRDRLKPIVFQQKLGTVYEKTERIGELAGFIAELINADKSAAVKAGQLSKADLASDMVLEFDKMQGVAGGYYARNDGLGDEIATAIQEHYQPKFAGDKVPSTPVACCVALADRLDTLCGIFGIGQEPSGSKDPFALRRASIGILQIILQNKLSLSLNMLLSKAVSLHSDAIENPAEKTERIKNYIFDRFAAMYQDQGIATEVSMAVRATSPDDALDFDARVQAVAEFLKSPECESLAAANKRVSNILAKSDSVSVEFNGGLLAEDTEKKLAAAIGDKESQCKPLFAEANYQDGLLALTDLREVVDSFFDDVMVNAEDEALKNNRLALLARLRALFMHTADISLLAVK